MGCRPCDHLSGRSRKQSQQACEASLRRLGVETIDLYQLHRLDPHTPMEETLAALAVELTSEQMAALERPDQPKPHLGITRPFQYPPPSAVHDRG